MRDSMNKKIFILLLATFLNPAHIADAQSSGKVSRIGFLAPQSRPAGRVEAFRQGLRDLGYVERQNIKFEYRGHEDRSQLTGLVTELLREKVDVIVTQGAATRAAQTAASVPIVFGYSGDPVEAGLVKSLHDQVEA